MAAPTTPIIPLINPSGAGTVLPVQPTPPPFVPNSIGLSTQLIIWGMVGFILVELLAIMCLLRYCCRARYIRKRKFKEKEIILADSSNIKETRPEYFLGRKTAIIATSTASCTQADHHQELHQHYAMEEHQSVSSMRPILTTGIPCGAGNAVCHQETIMIDEISTTRAETPPSSPPIVMTTTKAAAPAAPLPPAPPPPPPIYSKPQAPRSTVQIVHHVEDRRSPPTFVVEEHYARATDPAAATVAAAQELSSEDIYTLRFSTSVPATTTTQPFTSAGVRDCDEIIEVVEMSPVIAHRQKQSYLYNGTLNRPAFEIISHADVRPATPIKFEHVKELSPPSPPACSSSSYYPQYNQHSTFRGHTYQQQQQQQPQLHSYHHHYHSSSDDNHTAAAAAAVASSLLFGDERSFADGGGERVEWQVAHELRTTDWDELKELSARQTPYMDSRPQHHHMSTTNHYVNTSDANNQQSSANPPNYCTRISENTFVTKPDDNGPTTFTMNSPHPTTRLSHDKLIVVEAEETVDLTTTITNRMRTDNINDINNNHNNNDDDDDDMKTLIELGDFPPPPAQFQQQQTQKQQHRQKPQSINSRKSSKEEMRASHEIDLNNDSISLHTSNNQTPVRTNSTVASFESILAEIKTYNHERSAEKTNTAELGSGGSSSIIMSTHSAHLY